MSKKAKEYKEQLEAHIKDCQERQAYSIKRLDVLVITLSGSGIYFISELHKTLASIQPKPNETLLLWAMWLLLGVIGLNLISQWLGYYANKYEESFSILEKNSETQTKQEHCEQERMDRLSKKCGYFTNVFNIASTVLLLVAGILVITVLSKSFTTS